ncbi:hypothetical protein [Acaryochloris marina]|uniref:hypothetical protein n=1 Tax=Acaryochloris marina TaxID=155978 RepID=UPI001BB0C554|nr:hypothetical protein [Acaryochloris marina]
MGFYVVVFHKSEVNSGRPLTSKKGFADASETEATGALIFQKEIPFAGAVLQIFGDTEKSLSFDFADSLV